MKLDLHIGTPVHCKDKPWGKLVKVVVHPASQTVSDLIVRQGLIVRHDQVVPVSAVARAAPTEIALDLYSDELNSCPTYREKQVKVPAQGGSMVSRSGGMGPGFGPTVYESTTTMVSKRLREGVSADKQVIGRATKVKNLTHTLGHVNHVVAEGESNEISEIIIRKGAIPTYYVISRELVEEFDEEYILVSLLKEDWDALPRYAPRSDAEIVEELYDNLLTERTPAFHGIVPAANQGSVQLAGFVPSKTVKQHAEELAYLVPGVIDVQNDLVVSDGTDNVNRMEAATLPLKDHENLGTRVSTALAADKYTKNAVIEVIADRGIVTLQGEVEDAKTRMAAEKVVAGSPGVTSVVNELLIRSRA